MKIISLITVSLLMILPCHGQDIQPIHEDLFTDVELEWLDNHSGIRVGINESWAPFDFVDTNGKPQGIGVDLIGALNQRLGGSLIIKPGPWAQIYDDVENKKLDALMDITAKPSRDPFFNFTEPYLEVSHVIVTREESEYVRSEEDLVGKSISLESGFGNIQYFQTNYPGVRIKEYESTRLALEAVARGEVDAYAGNRAVATYLIKKEVMVNLKLNGLLNKPGSVLSIGTRKDWPILRDILQKALNDIAETEKMNILANWVQAEQGTSAASSFVLTSEEQKWLSQHPLIRVGMMDSWPPMDYVDARGEPMGIGVNFIDAINIRLNDILEIVPGPWSQIYGDVKSGQLDALTGITPLPEREQYFNFTKPYVTIAHAIFGGLGGTYFSTLADLEGKTVALEKGFFIVDVIHSRYPEIEVKEYSSTENALAGVSKGDADAYIGNRAVAIYIIENRSIGNLRQHGKIYETASVNAIGVRKDWPILRDILQKALDSLTSNEIDRILSKWVDTDSGSSSLVLTAEEKSWLAEHPVVTVAADPQYAPIEFRSSSEGYSGISMDFLTKISELLGIDFTVSDGITFTGSILKVANRELDMLSAVAENPQRREAATFTSSYLSLPTVIFTREDTSFISSLAELIGRKVAVVDGYWLTGQLMTDFPGIEFVEVSTISKALQSLSAGQVVAYVDTLLTAGYYAQQEGFRNVKVSGHTPYRLSLAMAARSDWPMLSSLLQKALDTISVAERNAIIGKWSAVTVERKTDYSLIWKWAISVMIIIVAILAAIIVWNRKLSQEIFQRKSAEEAAKLANEEKSDFLQFLEGIANAVSELIENKDLPNAMQNALRIIVRKLILIRHTYLRTMI
ncbi:MAG: transporter substrate-binding domain-containing protein [Spirochaetales bacterium]|nr:transporter substrate-binding domain-containing protein [Spirochaetales bacterium]